MRKLYLHVGMHKTGTTAIQINLHNHTSEHFAYIKLPNSNHSAIYSTLFMERPENYQAHKLNGRTRPEINELQKIYKEKYIENFAQSHRDYISSGEDISLLSRDELTSMKNWLKDYFDEVKIIAYVRPPAAHITSAFQQRLKGGLPLRNLFPMYRDKLEKFDHVFGMENVTIGKFTREGLYNHNIVDDFLKKCHLQYTPPSGGWKNYNESVSLETISLLYAINRISEVKNPQTRLLPYQRNKLVKNLSKIGNSKVTLRNSLIKSFFRGNENQIDWVEKRINEKINDFPQTNDGQVGDHEDLLRIAVSQLPELLKVIAKSTESNERNDEDALNVAANMIYNFYLKL